MFYGGAGVLFKDAKTNEYRRKVYDILWITPVKNFDMQGMIHDIMLVPPPPGSQNYTAALGHSDTFRGLWESIQSVEACNNLGLRGFGSIAQFDHDQYGPLGSARILSPFEIPTKISTLIKKAGGKLEGRQMHGLPKNFNMARECIVFQQYRAFGAEYLKASKTRMFDLRAKIRDFQEKRSVKKTRGAKKNSNEAEEEEEEAPAVVTVNCPGGWPCERVCPLLSMFV